MPTVKCPICNLAVLGQNNSTQLAASEKYPLRTARMRTPNTGRIRLHTFHGQCYRQADADGLIRHPPRGWGRADPPFVNGVPR